jgi:hypothetical protein
MYTRRVASYKAHIGNHFYEDIERTGVHLEALAAYPFENDVRFITQVRYFMFLIICISNFLNMKIAVEMTDASQYLRSGKSPLIQIMNGLAIAKRYGNVLDGDDELDEEFFNFCVKHKSLLHPAMRLRRFQKTSRMQKAICHGATVTNK